LLRCSIDNFGPVLHSEYLSPYEKVYFTLQDPKKTIWIFLNVSPCTKRRHIKIPNKSRGEEMVDHLARSPLTYTSVCVYVCVPVCVCLCVCVWVCLCAWVFSFLVLLEWLRLFARSCVHDLQEYVCRLSLSLVVWVW